MSSLKLFLNSVVLTDTLEGMVTIKTTANTTQEAALVDLSSPSISQGVKDVERSKARVEELPVGSRNQLIASGLNIAGAVEPSAAQMAAESKAFGEMIAGKAGLPSPVPMEATLRALRNGLGKN